MPDQETIINKLERGRAEFAYKCVEKVVNQLPDKAKEYRSYARKIPTMILTNGLGQTLAFIKAKKEGKAYEILYQQLTEYLKSDSTMRVTIPQGENDLTEWVIKQNSTEYKYITQELLAFLRWLSRFAEGMIEGGE